MHSHKQEIIIKTLYGVYPFECKIVGESNVENLASGFTKQVSSTGGANFDISVFMDILSSATTIAGSAYDFIMQKKKGGNEPSNEEVKTDLYNNKQINISIKDTKCDNIIIIINQEINNNPESGEQDI